MLGIRISCAFEVSENKRSSLILRAGFLGCYDLVLEFPFPLQERRARRREVRSSCEKTDNCEKIVANFFVNSSSFNLECESFCKNTAMLRTKLVI